jgi:predicted RNase H-like nuclease (RuvC/YqgF family)
MDWSALLLGLLGGGMVSAVAQMIAAKSTAKKSEVEALRGIIEALQTDNVSLRKEVHELRAENETLRRQLGIKSDGRTSKGLALDR